jgi:hypothetical protein
MAASPNRKRTEQAGNRGRLADQDGPRPQSPEARPQRPKQRGKAAPKRKSRFTAANIAVGGTVIGTAVGALPQYLQLPAQAVGAGIVSVGAVTVWQQLTGKAEERRSKQRPPRHNRKGEPI